MVFEYIEIHDARERKHSSNGWKTPKQYENEFAESLHHTPQSLIHFSGQGQLEMLVEILRRVGKVLEDIRKIFCLTLASWLTASKFMLLSLAFSLN